ncbi:GntR family transcriptional regulator [Microbacterium sp. cf332]|uniref:GntR family transcriptional regulator n=1 Tax=Microbacterium sp. cf332 TaxID=1761804 RepID=UPI000881EEF3|nr:GntR family transcriptional regulator [Microbacterium sp. cf332]SDQ96719.1 GntR family transcriptional regulator [Microbacterium sp. cf332]
MTAPKYRELADMLLGRIGDAAIGDPMPSERQLADETGVSRMTARRAIDELVRQGLLTREVGRGTFVSRPAVTMPLQLTSFTEDMRARGHVPSSRVLRSETAPADPASADVFGIRPGDPLLVLARLRLADGIPMAIERSQLRVDRFPGLEQHDFAVDSLYRVLLDEYGVRFEAGEQVIRAGIVRDDDAATLRLAPGAAVLELIRTSKSHGEVVERTVSTYSAARFELSAQIAPVTAPGSAPRSALRVRR